MPRPLLSDVLENTLRGPVGPWRRVDVCRSVGSTNDEAVASPVAWRFIAAARQSGGHGRHARSWSSPEGSVAVSMTVPMAARTPSWGWFPLFTGLAVVRALGAASGRPEAFAVKWPNDVLAVRPVPVVPPEPSAESGYLGPGDAGFGKVAGVLCRSTPERLGVAGVGVNVAVAASELPVPTAVSLHEVAPLGEHPREDVLIALAQEFARLHADWFAGGAGFARLRREYRDVCRTIGSEVVVHGPDGVRTPARVVDVDDTGELVVLPLGDGEPEAVAPVRFAAADVVHVRARGGA